MSGCQTSNKRPITQMDPAGAASPPSVKKAANDGFVKWAPEGPLRGYESRRGLADKARTLARRAVEARGAGTGGRCRRRRGRADRAGFCGPALMVMMAV